MRTQEVLNSIDHALGDWTVSGDAMRWTPEPHREARPAPRVDRVVTIDVGPFMRAAAEAAQSFGRMAQSVAVSLGEIEAFAKKVREADRSDEARMARALTEEDPRARALALRRARNTGPSRDITKLKRPRKHLA